MGVLLDTFMNLGTFLSTMGALPKMYALLKNRDELKGFSIAGISLKIGAIGCFTIAQALLAIWLSVAFNALLLTYQFVKLYYVWRIERPQDFVYFKIAYCEKAESLSPIGRFFGRLAERKKKRIMGD